jgi:hypothetical protein
MRHSAAGIVLARHSRTGFLLEVSGRSARDGATGGASECTLVRHAESQVLHDRDEVQELTGDISELTERGRHELPLNCHRLNIVQQIHRVVPFERECLALTHINHRRLTLLGETT